MKSKSIFLLPVTILFICFTACTHKMAVQASGTDISYTSPDKKDTAAIIYTNDINAKILRSFYLVYGETPTAKWFKSANGYGVSFNLNGISNIIYYKNNGMVEAELLYYFEDRLPQRVKQLLKGSFRDYSITHVTEVHRNEATAYYVKVENTSTIKTVKVVDEEWELVETLAKR